MAYRPGMTTGVSFGPGPLTKAVKQLLIANVGVFLLSQLARDLRWNTTFGLVPASVFGELKLWQPATYLFLHGDFWHVLFNMFALWMFGVPLERQWGYRAFMRFFLGVGIAAGLITCLFLFGSTTPTIGASGAIMGILVGFAMLYPDTPILIGFLLPVPARIFVLIYAVLEFLSARQYASDGVGHVTHLAGMAVAFIVLKADWRPRAAIDRFGRRLRARSRGLRVVDSRRKAGATGEPEVEVDAILDKISREGIDSLTESELRKLRERSR